MTAVIAILTGALAVRLTVLLTHSRGQHRGPSPYTRGLSLAAMITIVASVVVIVLALFV